MSFAAAVAPKLIYCLDDAFVVYFYCLDDAFVMYLVLRPRQRNCLETNGLKIAAANMQRGHTREPQRTSKVKGHMRPMTRFLTPVHI